MSYLHLGTSFYTPAGIIIFTNKCNSVKLNESTYEGEEPHVIKEKIRQRRQQFTDAVESAVAKIAETVVQRPKPSGGGEGGAGAAGSKKRALEGVEADPSDWERRIRAIEARAPDTAKIDELNAKAADMERRAQAAEAKERAATAENDELKLKLADMERRAPDTAKIDELNAKVADMERRAQAAEAKERAATAENDELKPKMADMRRQMQELESAKADMERLVQSAENRERLAQTATNEMTLRMHRLESEKTAAEFTLHELNANVAKPSEAYSRQPHWQGSSEEHQLKSEVKLLSEAARTKEMEIMNRDKEIATLQSQKINIQTNVDNLRKELIRAKEEISNKDKDSKTREKIMRALINGFEKSNGKVDEVYEMSGRILESMTEITRAVMEAMAATPPVEAVVSAVSP
jgi:chromosome segregation ATPase